MAEICKICTYEEIRKQRLEENKKRFEDLGISKISKSLSEVSKSPAKRSYQPSISKKSEGSSNGILEPRRSTRERNPVQSYSDEAYIDLPPLRKRKGSKSTFGSYLARPIDEFRIASYEERALALKSAEVLQSSLESGKPSFVKSMVRSHVYSCFWLGLPSKFCDEHLPKTLFDMVLENEEGKEYNSVYIGKRAGLSGGWRGFALEHKLDDGDALVFELIEPNRFKIYVCKAYPISNRVHNGSAKKELNTGSQSDLKTNPKKRQKKEANAEESGSGLKSSPKLQEEERRGEDCDHGSEEQNQTERDDEFGSSKLEKKGESESNELEKKDECDENNEQRKIDEVENTNEKKIEARKPRKQRAERLLRRRV